MKEAANSADKFLGFDTARLSFDIGVFFSDVEEKNELDIFYTTTSEKLTFVMQPTHIMQISVHIVEPLIIYSIAH